MILAGLLDDNCEMFVKNGKLHCFTGGNKIEFEKLPLLFINYIDSDIEKNETFEYAKLKCGSSDIMKIREQHCICNFGGSSVAADITIDGTINHEYFDCGERSKCKVEGKLCKHVKVKNGYLTPREIKYLKSVAIGLLNKEIADEMIISEETVASYSKTVQQKTGLHRKSEFAILAYELGLI